MPDDINQLLNEAADRIKRESYAAGWRDAMTACKNAIASVENPSIPEAIKLETNGAMTTALDPKPPAAPAGRTPTVGSTPYYVLNAVKQQPGMSSLGAVEAVQTGGHNVPEGSIRTSLFRLKERKFIVQRHGKWFPA